MTIATVTYHRQREQECRVMAEDAADPEIRRLHKQLADLHAGAAERCAQVRA